MIEYELFLTLKENDEDRPPIVPPRHKHSGKMLKQQSELNQSMCNGLPMIPKVKVSAHVTMTLRIIGIIVSFELFYLIEKMGAGLVKIFDQCPLVIHCASTWIHPETKDQLILFGSELGIYSLNLKMYFNGESTLELVTFRETLSTLPLNV